MIALSESQLYTLRQAGVVSLAGVAALIAVAGKPGLSASEMATRAKIFGSSVTQVVDRFNLLRIMERGAHESDRRRQCIYLTPAGVALAKKAGIPIGESNQEPGTKNQEREA